MTQWRVLVAVREKVWRFLKVAYRTSLFTGSSFACLQEAVLVACHMQCNWRQCKRRGGGGVLVKHSDVRWKFSILTAGRLSVFDGRADVHCKTMVTKVTSCSHIDDTPSAHGQWWSVSQTETQWRQVNNFFRHKFYKWLTFREILELIY